MTPSSAAAVLDACRSVAPATVLLDLHLGADLDGLDLVEPLVALRCLVVVLTGEQGDDIWGAALEQGASAVLPKDVDIAQLVDTVQRVQSGRTSSIPADGTPCWQQHVRRGLLSPSASPCSSS